MKDNEYQCASCGDVCEKGRSDEEAWTEYDANFPGESHDDDIEVVCDDCYQKMVAQLPPPGMATTIGNIDWSQMVSLKLDDTVKLYPRWWKIFRRRKVKQLEKDVTEWIEKAVKKLSKEITDELLYGVKR